MPFLPKQISLRNLLSEKNKIKLELDFQSKDTVIKITTLPHLAQRL